VLAGELHARPRRRGVQARPRTRGWQQTTVIAETAFPPALSLLSRVATLFAASREGVKPGPGNGPVDRRGAARP
jgi:hypothetical protein